MKKCLQNSENYSQNGGKYLLIINDKEICAQNKELSQFNNMKTNNPIKTLARSVEAKEELFQSVQGGSQHGRCPNH